MLNSLWFRLCQAVKSGLESWRQLAGPRAPLHFHWHCWLWIEIKTLMWWFRTARFWIPSAETRVPCSYPLIPCEENCAKQFSPALSSADGTVKTWRLMLNPSSLLLDSMGPDTSCLEGGLKLPSGWRWKWMCYIFPWKSEEGEACCLAI